MRLRSVFSYICMAKTAEVKLNIGTVNYFIYMSIDTLTARGQSMNIIDQIRERRNDLIKDFLDERTLINYVSEQYKITDLSPMKIQFIKNELKDLLASPVDAEFFKPLIDESKKTDNFILEDYHDKFFYQEIMFIIKNYIY
jgi:hypothetical protein